MFCRNTWISCRWKNSHVGLNCFNQCDIILSSPWGPFHKSFCASINTPAGLRFKLVMKRSHAKYEMNVWFSFIKEVHASMEACWPVAWNWFLRQQECWGWSRFSAIQYRTDRFVKPGQNLLWNGPLEAKQVGK